MDQNDYIFQGIGSLLKDEDRDFEDVPLTQTEIAAIVEQCFDEIRNENTEPKMREFFKTCLKFLKEEITYQ